MREVPIAEAKEQLLELIEAVLGGERIMISTEDQRAVWLTPARFGGGTPKFGSAKGLITMRDDFDAPLEEFEEYMK